MNAVIEIYEVGQLVDARPFERPAGAKTFAHGLQISGVGPDLRMAIHAGLGGRDAGEARRFNRGMTVAAIDAEPGYVMLVAEGNGLILSDTGVRDVRSALQLDHNPGQAAHGDDHEDQRGPGDGIAAAR